MGKNVQFVDFKDVFLFFGKELMPTKFGDENRVLKVSPTPGAAVNFAPFTSYQIFRILIRKPKKTHFWFKPVFRGLTGFSINRDFFIRKRNVSAFSEKTLTVFEL